MKTDADRKQRERQDSLDRAVVATVAREITKMPTAKKAQLRKEVMNQGLTAEVVRI
jgi:hypothetical protein